MITGQQLDEDGSRKTFSEIPSNCSPWVWSSQPQYQADPPEKYETAYEEVKPVTPRVKKNKNATVNKNSDPP